MGKERLLRIVWAVGLCVVSGATVIVADTWYHGTGRVQDNDPLPACDPAHTAGEVRSGIEALSAAGNVRPADGATDVPRDATLTWPAGQQGGMYDVYFGTSAADVNSATRMDMTGVLVSLGQAGTTFLPPDPLAYGQTYYWRIDEVNVSAGGTVYKGAVWSFTVEPYAYTVKPISALASSAQANMGPEKTIDGSGLTGDQHGTEPTTMWLSTGTPPNWIQYQFDAVYRLYELKVWNSNQVGEGLTGFGARKVTIDYSDGVVWRTLDNVAEFAPAPGAAGYAANTTIPLGGVLARHVRLTIHSTWAGIGNITGLSEVRFSAVPVQAFAPQPADEAREVSIETTLTWRPGREAGVHQVFFSTDQAAVEGETVPAETVTEPRYVPRDVNFTKTYYWKVNEVNTVTYVGDVWSFTTGGLTVDDFESYNDTDNRIHNTWIDGRTDGTSGSIAGYRQAPFAERAIVHGGKQSLPIEYNNVKAPYYSQVSRTFAAPQDWTAHGVTDLMLYYRGHVAGFVDHGNNAFTIDSGGTDIGGTSDRFCFICKHLSGDGSLTLAVDYISSADSWSKVGVMVRETLETGSKYAYIASSWGGGVSFQWRDTTKGPTASTWTAGLDSRYWVRITRTGNVFRAERSPDGETWTREGTLTTMRSPDGETWTQKGTDTTIVMTRDVYIGMVMDSHNVAKATYANVSNVTSTGAVTGSWQRCPIGKEVQTNDPTSLFLIVEDDAGKRGKYVGYEPAATTADSWTPWYISLRELSAAGVNLRAVKKLTIGIGGSNPKPGGTGLIYIDDIALYRITSRPATRS
jgi:hypothetical protein